MSKEMTSGRGAMSQADMELAGRDKLGREKPHVLERILEIEKRHALCVPTPMIDIAYSYRCNLKCRHCAAARFAPKERRLTPSDVRRISDEAYAFGLCQFVVSGGEPLLFVDLDDVVAALQPQRFHLAMSTNGHLLTPEKARHLKAIGLDKVKISLDDFDESAHNKNRKSSVSYRKAIDAMFNAQAAGLNVAIQSCVTHQNCQTDGMVDMAKFAQEHGFALDVIAARAIGEWEGKEEVLIDESDAEFLRTLHDRYPVVHRDTFPSFGMDKGCNCVKALLHITPYGDVLPCVFIHISIGNIFEEDLAAIIARGQSIRYFRDFNRLCLSGEDRAFISSHMTKFYGKPLPLHWSEAFHEDDFE
jgi:MoaA/NifB/PqqE/SkfB family radical SAM enzyme